MARETKAAASDRLTLPDVAEELDRSEKTVRRLIKKGYLLAERYVVRGKNRWIVERWAVERYKLLEWVDRQFCDFLLPGAPGSSEAILGGFDHSFVFHPWGQADQGQRLPRAELTVSLQDLWRLAYQRPATREAYEALREEIRRRIPGQPEAFEIRFRLDQDATTRTLQAIVNKVRPPVLPGRGEEALKAAALKHLVTKTLPALRRVREDPDRYLLRSVKNFYRDQYRREFGVLPGVDALDRATLDLDQADQKVFEEWQRDSNH